MFALLLDDLSWLLTLLRDAQVILVLQVSHGGQCITLVVVADKHKPTQPQVPSVVKLGNV